MSVIIRKKVTWADWISLVAAAAAAAVVAVVAASAGEVDVDCSDADIDGLMEHSALPVLSTFVDYYYYYHFYYWMLLRSSLLSQQQLIHLGLLELLLVSV